MKKRSKRYQAAQKLRNSEKQYDLGEALEILSQMPSAKFDETVSLSVHFGVNPKNTEQMVRGIVKLPHGSGKKPRIIAFTENPSEALGAGACEAGLFELIEKVQGGWLDFDVAVATPEAMKEVRKVARVLGPRGLMPNPRSGTVSDRLTDAIKELERGRVEFKMDKSANADIVVGRYSFKKEQLSDNVHEILRVLESLKPLGLKGRYVKRVTISSTMSPGIVLSSSLYSKF